MNSAPTPPDPGYWFNIAEHLEGLLGLMTGAIATAGLAVWRLAVWTTSVKAEIAQMREASEERQKTILEKLDENEKRAHGRHEATQREMDQIREIARDDRDETREHRKGTRDATAALSGRIDNALSHRG